MVVVVLVVELVLVILDVVQSLTLAPVCHNRSGEHLATLPETSHEGEHATRDVMQALCRVISKGHWGLRSDAPAVQSRDLACRGSGLAMLTAANSGG